jgi:hypothetical protein
MTVFIRLLLLLLICVMFAGCRARRTGPIGPPVAFTSTKPVGHDPVLEAVDPTRIELDVEKRTVRLFPLESGHWLVILPGQPQEKIQGLEYRVPDNVKLDEVKVYFVVPGVRSSNAVTLAEVKKKT